MLEKSPSTALLLLDFIPAVVPAFGGSPDLLQKVQHLANEARISGVPTIFTRTAFRPGSPEVTKSNRLIHQVAHNYPFGEGDLSSEICPELKPSSDDIVVTKRRVSAFFGTDLEIVLRSMHINALVLAGVCTSGVVLSTVRDAADRDYQVTVLVDGCADVHEEDHQYLMNRIIPMHATLSTVDDWLTTLASAAAQPRA
ncbi:isochorismatase [Streptomyces viridiviolaceus]|uniref:Cysteine hydrolase family protein n=1 Tax=Streptomyces viridiviolaceus TaxID=68282 RepID=A0ABW2E7I9_9ACTN|nr:cysteine hydrolase [Streptomyces viridiviolaceus]GHB67521.1 isochorismatase [Streptomyces viridiviolaceus]